MKRVFFVLTMFLLMIPNNIKAEQVTNETNRIIKEVTETSLVADVIAYILIALAVLSIVIPLVRKETAEIQVDTSDI
jgi:hypothetical protein